jgi:hypothetical protein
MDRNEPKRDKPRQPRRWFQFGLRSLLVLVLAAALAMAAVHRARQQRTAVAALLQSNPGATIYYDFQLDDGRPRAEAAPPGPQWFRRLFGVDFVATVTAITLDYATDADLERLEHLTGLRQLTLVRSVDLTDKGMSSVGRLGSLRVLSLDAIDRVTDKGLAHLEGLTNLQRLMLGVRPDRVSREAIERLRRALPNCQVEITGQEPESSGVSTRVRHSVGSFHARPATC